MKTSPILKSFFIAFFLSIPNGNAEKLRLKDIPEDPAAPAPDPVLQAEEKKALVEEVCNELYVKAIEAFNRQDYEQAEALFDRILVLKPDHAEAKKGIDSIMKKYEQADVSDKKKTSKKSALINRLTQDLNQAFNKGQYTEAEQVAEKIVAIDPSNQKAKQKIKVIHHKLHQFNVERGQEFEKDFQFQNAINAYRTALEYKTDPSLKLKIDDLENKISLNNQKKSDELYVQALKANQSGDNPTAILLCKKALTLDPDNIQAKHMLDRLQSTTP